MKQHLFLGPHRGTQHAISSSTHDLDDIFKVWCSPMETALKIGYTV